MKTVMIWVTVFAVTFLLTRCDDHIDVQQSYGFDISTWHLPTQIAQGEEVEIRFTLHREGDYRGGAYYFSCIQTQGRGEVYDSRGMFYTDREEYELRIIPQLDISDPYAYRFTLYYRSLSTEDSQIRFVVRDTFGVSREIECSLRSGDD